MSPEALRSSIGGMVGGICFLVVGVLMVKTGKDYDERQNESRRCR